MIILGKISKVIYNYFKLFIFNFVATSCYKLYFHLVYPCFFIYIICKYDYYTTINIYSPATSTRLQFLITLKHFIV